MRMKPIEAAEDVMFIKLLLIAFSGNENVVRNMVDTVALSLIKRKEQVVNKFIILNGKIDDNIFQCFFPVLFEVRIKKNENRRAKFDGLLEEAIQEIRNGR